MTRLCFPAPLADTLIRELPLLDTAPRSIRDADRAQGQLLAIFDRHQHAAGAFLRVYHGITVAVLAALDDGTLTPRPFFERLAGRFAEKHFDGVRAALGVGPITDAARYRLWEPSFGFDRTPSAPLAHFLVGMSCHINADLAVALEETIRELGHAGDPGALAAIERGHAYVDAILAREVAASMDALARELGCPLARLIVDADLVPLAGRAAMQVIRTWRARTFPAALRLLAAPTPAARRRERERIYRDATRTTEALLAFLPHLTGLLQVPDAERALAAALRLVPAALADHALAPAPGRATRAARRVLRGVHRAGLGAALHAVRTRLVAPADRALSAAARGARGARMALGLLDVALRLDRLAA